MQEAIQGKYSWAENNDNIYLKNIIYEGVDWINLAQCTDQRRVGVIKAKKF
jgi:hypothetical protein